MALQQSEKKTSTDPAVNPHAAALLDFEIRVKAYADLHKRLATFMNHLQKVSRSLGNAVDSFNASVGSMERNVLPQARKFTELGVTSESLPALDPIEQPVRTIAQEAKAEAEEPLSPFAS